MIIDKFSGVAAGLSAPAGTIFTIEPDDAADLPILTRAINVARSGDLRVTMADGTTGTLFLAAGSLVDLRVRRVWATGTSAEGICGLS
ncbi:spike base protein, RCAP_Rcc01079 family [Paracoccus sediminis]|jgi:hypothetical protein|uniref:Uncharacterized protein n=1 Tax=Paracoccus sediminis TaxID=1214787 RepID=A0A238Y735_9RHOB|nr:hypothetical protein [Paracoccus sediminis]SNR66917.1 hypothetical protein SAMN06265378_11547 [Paracoccus sediminis]